MLKNRLCQFTCTTYVENRLHPSLTVFRLAANALEMGKSMPDGLLKISKARTMPELQVQISEMVRLLEENLAKIPGKGVTDLLEQGTTLEKELRASDAEQEVKRWRELPETIRDFYHTKGLLYTGLKMINNEGHALHADDPLAAGRYNMDILHRRNVKHQPVQMNAAA
ncbi:MAG: hypothetical protein JW768_06995 [Chitinispirillaceae bacterium]|nr:hypothetical protein [Chitinispirillaceae bacterium]